MSTITKQDKVMIVIGEWFDKVNGNTYYDATISVNGEDYLIPYKYGYSANNEWNLKELLNQIGLRIRKDKRVLDYCKVYTQDKLKRDLNK